MRYKKSYSYDPVFALGFVTVYDQLMEGYPSDEDRNAIFQAYIKSLNEDPDQYRVDAQKLEEWARDQNSTSLVDFSSREGEVETLNVNKRSVDRDLDVYRNLLSKLVQAKELLKEYVDREKKKREERSEPQKANEAISKCLGQQQFAGL
ncbi:unnamed protein product [Lupinus luteus]|uniref:Uncharacterized protein n=1 Tax=Lupinus luteus TaxID=3873 RepID=A0AAV1YIT2_LUPLU